LAFEAALDAAAFFGAQVPLVAAVISAIISASHHEMQSRTAFGVAQRQAAPAAVSSCSLP
jgi:hypothetical protein